MERCLDSARANSIHVIALEVRKSNDGAQAFYRTLSFADTYIRPRYYPDGEAAGGSMMRSIGRRPTLIKRFVAGRSGNDTRRSSDGRNARNR